MASPRLTGAAPRAPRGPFTTLKALAQPYLLGLMSALTAAHSAGAEAPPTNPFASPNNRIRVSINMPVAGTAEQPSWSASFRGKPILTGCRLGLLTAAEGDWLAGAHVLNEKRRSVDERVPVLFGKAGHAADRFNEVRYTLGNAGHARADLVFRCYDDAIALRYELPAGTPALRSPLRTSHLLRPGRAIPPRSSSIWRISRRPTSTTS